MQLEALEPESRSIGRSTVSVLLGACAAVPIIACTSMNGAAAAQACGMQATG
ncbi:MAG: hypothetical protein ACXVWJ_26135 [Solirubrobacteraceae bacterium]